MWEGLPSMLGLKLGRCPCIVNSTGTFWRGNVKFSKWWWWGDEEEEAGEWQEMKVVRPAGTG